MTNLSNNRYVEQGLQSANTDLDKLSKDASKHLSKYVSGFSSGIVNFVGTITEIILSVAVLPFILFYLLKDGEELT